jgi:CDGSH-type Zn-finger protein
MSADARLQNRKPVRKIRVEPDGPYTVIGEIPLSEQSFTVDSEGFSTGYETDCTYPTEGAYCLCRCGKSCDKPFCDGSHIPAGFDGSETAGDEEYLKNPDRTVGALMDLVDFPALCASARFCDRAGGIWDATRASDDPAKKALAQEEAGNCPAGRLVLLDKQGAALEPAFEPSIVAVHDTQLEKIGPLWVRGEIPIESADGRTYAVRNRVTLCRCGKSENKPFCDGRHCDP